MAILQRKKELMVIVRKASQRHHFRLMILFRVPDVDGLSGSGVLQGCANGSQQGANLIPG